MPYCVQCGTSVTDQDQFCGKCGARQAAAARPASDFWANISARNAAILCYIPWVGWIAGIAVLASARFRDDARIRFHAFQGLYLFVAWLMIEWVISPFVGFPRPFGSPDFFRIVPRMLHVLVLVAWIFMIIKASHDEDYRLPILGELADRSVSEQRS